MSDSSEQKKLMMDALLALKKSQAKVKALQQAQNEPIAIIGMSCRLPADANDMAGVVELLANGTDAVSRIPAQRWDVDFYHDSDPQAAGKMASDQGGFINDIDKFDNQFFKISPREANFMDPQHRLLLMSAWRALENANIVPGELYQRPVGTFVGISTMDYLHVIEKQIDEREIDGYITAGNIHSVAPGRIASYLGLTGPAVSIDTACSSSLIAVHQACESLRNNSCELALAAGVNSILNPLLSVTFSKAQMLSSDGRCKTFDDSANGYVRGEGVGVVVLKRLSDAQRDNDNILALIKGSATNHNGPSGGLTVPSGSAQQQVIEQAIKNAGIEANDVDCIEAHGTGTALGDPIELRALDQVYGGSSRQNPLWVSSIKTNIGHLEAAAGIAGLIKMVAQLQQRTIYSHLHFNQPSSHIDWQQSVVSVPRKTMPWPEMPAEKPAIGGVSSFGINGSNAHIVLAEAPQSEIASVPAQSPKILTLAAKTAQGLQAQLAQYHGFIAASSESDLASICYSSNLARSHFEHRVAFVVSNKTELLQQLADYSQCSQAQHVNKRAIAMLLDGESELDVAAYQRFSGFNVAYQQGLDLALNANFAAQYALAQLLLTWGVMPSAMVGLGKGEIIVSCIEGQLTLAQAAVALKRYVAVDKPDIDLTKLDLVMALGTASLEVCRQQSIDTIDVLEPDLCLAQLYMAGVSLAWDKVYPAKRYDKAILPNYPFKQECCWLQLDGKRMDNDQWLATSDKQTQQLIEQFLAADHKLVYQSQLQSDEFKCLLAQLLAHFIAPFIHGEQEIAPVYRRWLQQSLRLLQQEQMLLANVDGSWQLNTDKLLALETVQQQWQQLQPQLLQQQEIQAYVKLLDVCFAHLPQILKGETKATDVLFPQGSMALMGEIYQRTPQSDLFNDIAHQHAIAYIKKLIASGHKKIRILEVGAGTGGTTAGLVSQLEPLKHHIDCYCYTDLSPAFLRHGVESYGSQAPYLTTQLLDIEKPPGAQSFEPQSYDVVIATNVLHATLNMNVTMAHVKSLLRRDGLLLLNEISDTSFMFVQLSMALLEGWWRFEDEAIRIEGSPGLYPEAWQQLLNDNGFDAITFPAKTMHQLGQQVIVAQSDGQVSAELLQHEQQQLNMASLEQLALTGNLTQQLTAYLQNVIGEALQMAPSQVEPQVSLDNYGIDSIIIAQLLGQLQRYCPQMESSALIEYNQIDQIAEYLLSIDQQGVETMLADGRASLNEFCPDKTNVDRRSVTCIKPYEQAKARILVFHPFGFGYRSIGWMQKLADDIEVWAVGCEHIDNWQQLVTHLSDEVKSLFEVPVIAWGHSMGAVVAFETLYHLEQQHQLMAQQLVVSSSSITLFERLKHHGPFFDFDETSNTQEVMECLTQAHILPPAELSASLAVEGVMNDVQLCKSYVRDHQRKLTAPIVAVQANNDIMMPDASVLLDWQQVTTGDFRLEQIDGTHMFFTRPPQAFTQLLLESCHPSTHVANNAISTGVYQLTDMCAGTSDLHMYPLSRKAQGLLIYDGLGNSAAHLWHPKRPLNNGEVENPSYDAGQLITYIAYAGGYQQHSGMIEHEIKVASVANWEGKTFKRSIKAHQQSKQGISENFTLITSPMVYEQQHQFMPEFHQILDWQAMTIKMPSFELGCVGCWQLVSIEGDERLLSSSSYQGQCLITEQGIISVQISPIERPLLRHHDVHMSSDAEIAQALSQSIRFAAQITSQDEVGSGKNSFICELMVSQSCIAIDLTQVEVERHQDELVLTWRSKQNGTVLVTRWLAAL